MWTNSTTSQCVGFVDLGKKLFRTQVVQKAVQLRQIVAQSSRFRDARRQMPSAAGLRRSVLGLGRLGSTVKSRRTRTDRLTTLEPIFVSVGIVHALGDRDRRRIDRLAWAPSSIVFLLWILYAIRAMVQRLGRQGKIWRPRSLASVESCDSRCQWRNNGLISCRVCFPFIFVDVSWRSGRFQVC